VTEKDKEMLAQFHHTISEQLNARLAESPKFFALLVVVSTGYGYVLADSKLSKLVPVATLLSLAATFWASWYLAALGYAFRFLQNVQHRIEGAVEWNRFTPMSGIPPSLRNPLNWYWLLPGIYHAHVAGLNLLFVLICFTGLTGYKRFELSIAGVAGIALMNLYYVRKFKAKVK
jgi:hypothetical protein